MDAARQLKAFRESQTPPLSPAGLAKLLGVSRSYVHRLESGERKPGRELLPVIRERTGLTPREMRPDLVEMLEAAE